MTDDRRAKTLLGMKYSVEPVARVHCDRIRAVDDDWDAVPATIELEPRFDEDAIEGLEAFSHLVIVYLFDQVAPDEVHVGARHPRGNVAWPRLGIFAQRGRKRPNRLGVTTCRLVGIQGRLVQVRGLDAIEGTPVLDIKPYMASFGPRGEVREPAWVAELMAGSWQQT